MLPLVLLPMGSSRRRLCTSSLASFVVFAAPLMSLLVGMGWVTYFDRYVLPFAVVLGALIPVAAGRAGGLVAAFQPRLRGVLAFVCAGMAAGWCWQQWPGHDALSLARPESARSSEYHAGVFARWAQDTLREGDGILDCAGLAVDSLILPDKIDYSRFPPGDPECSQGIQKPVERTGRSFLITMHRDLPQNSGAGDLAFNAAAIRALGWQPVAIDAPTDGYKVWVK